MNTQINPQNNEYYKIDHFNYKNKMYKLQNYIHAKFTYENDKIKYEKNINFEYYKIIKLNCENKR